MKNFLNKNILNEYKWLKEKIIKYRYNFFFLMWLVLMFFVIFKLRYFYLIFIFYLNISTLFLLIKKNPKIIITDKKINIFISLYKINFLKSINSSKFDKEMFFLLIIYWFFRIIFGIGYKLIKIWISLFDCFYNEYEWSNINSKKLNKKIIKTYVSRSFEKWIFIEFIKIKPKLNEFLIIKKYNYEKKIIIIIK